MAKLTWLGAPDYQEGESPPAVLVWNGIQFPQGEAVEVIDVGMIAKARGNRTFTVEEEPQTHATQWREPDTEADPADVSFFDDPPPSPDFADVLPDYPPEDDPERGNRKRGRSPKVKADGDR